MDGFPVGVDRDGDDLVFAQVDGIVLFARVGVILVAIIVVILNMLSGFMATDKNKILLLESMGASKWQILRKLVIPSALPDFIGMLKICVGMAWIGSIMGEYIVSRAGLGYLIVYGGQVFKLDLVMAATFILCVLAAGMYALVALAEKLIVKGNRRV